MNIQAAPQDAAYKAALTEYYQGMPSFEQKAGLQLLNTLLGKTERAGPGMQRVTLNRGPDGKQTSPRDKHIWSFNPATGQPDQYIGPATQAPPTPGSGNVGAENRLWLSIDRNIKHSVMQEMAFEGLGKLVTLPDGSMTIRFNTPSVDLPEYQRRIAERIKFEQNQERLPRNWFSPLTGQPESGNGEPEEYLIDTIEQAQNVPVDKIFNLGGVRYRRTAKGGERLD